MDEFGQPIYIETQPFQHQMSQDPNQNQTKHQRQLISATTVQSITPDHFLGNDFDWFDLGTPVSNKVTHTRTATDPGITPPISASSTTSSVHNGNNSSSYELFNAMVATSGVKSEAASLSTLGFSGLEISSLGRDSPSQLGFEQDVELSTGFSMKSRRASGPTGSKLSRRRRFKAQKDHVVSTAVTSSNVDAQPPTPSMPTPLSPVASFPEGRVLHLPLQRSNVNVKQEISEPAMNALTTSMSVSAQANSIAFYDMLSMTTSNVDNMFGQHHRVLSTTSQDSRGGAGGAHCSVSSPIPSSVPHARCSSSNSTHIVTSLSIQPVPRKEVFPVEYGIKPKRDSLISIRAGDSIKSNSSAHTSPDPEAEAGRDIENSIDFNGESSPTNNEDDEESDMENSRPATCPHCNKEFQSKGLLRSHVVSHSSDRPFVCWDCTDKSYKRNHDLLRHRREKHNVDGIVVPSRGSSRNGGGARESAIDRISHQPTVASQNRISHHEIIYPSHNMMYLGSSGISDLSSPSSGSPMDPYGNLEYNQHSHGHSLYGSHSHANADLGLGLDLNHYDSKDIPSRLNMNPGGEASHSASGRRTSRGCSTGMGSSAPISSGRKRKLSNSTTTSLISSNTMMMVPSQTSTTNPILTAVPSHSQSFHHSQQIVSLSGTLENLGATQMGHFGSGGA
ncbi:hypothetical protein BGZ76_006526 [Entomortierella beljakovae]|nr:hypothetical protein BGZ76_006526 [Entomortierella beljakovae]